MSLGREDGEVDGVLFGGVELRRLAGLDARRWRRARRSSG